MSNLKKDGQQEGAVGNLMDWSSEEKDKQFGGMQTSTRLTCLQMFGEEYTTQLDHFFNIVKSENIAQRQFLLFGRQEGRIPPPLAPKANLKNSVIQELIQQGQCLGEIPQEQGTSKTQPCKEKSTEALFPCGHTVLCVNYYMRTRYMPQPP